MFNDQSVYQWLMEGDPSIRWQVMRDLLGYDDNAVAGEREKVATQGWGAKLLSYQDASGRWGGQFYGNKWLSTTYTLQLLRRMGLGADTPQTQPAFRQLLDGGFQPQGGISFARTVPAIDNGVTGMVLAIAAYFKLPDPRLPRIAAYLAGQQMPDGRWEPYPGNRVLKYTFDTTLLILEGLYEFGKNYQATSFDLASINRKGYEFLLNHQLYKNKLGELVDSKITLFSFPPRWHYDVLVALDYFQACHSEKDPRFKDAVDLVIRKRSSDGTWSLHNRHTGKTYFELETVGKPSRWNTLRALRVLKWWEKINMRVPA